MQLIARIASLLLGLLALSSGASSAVAESTVATAQQNPPAADERPRHADAPLLIASDRGLGPVRIEDASHSNHMRGLDDRLAHLLRIGAPVPPGLSAARAKERRAARDAALAALAAELGSSAVLMLDTVLSDPNAPLDQWEAAAAAVGDLSLTRLAPKLAAELDSPGTSMRRAPARRALYALYGIWFDTKAEVEPLALLVESPALTSYRDHVRALEDRLLSQLPRVWAIDTEAALAALTDRSPRVRAAAARALGSAAGAGRLEPVALADALIAQLRHEGDGTVLNALLESLAPAMQGRTPIDERVIELRTLLAHGIRGAPNAQQHVLTRMLAALPWDQTSANVPEAAASGIRLAQLAFERVVESEPIDTDVVIGVLQSLRSLVQAHPVQRAELGMSPSAPVLALLARAGVPRHVRIAAAASLADFATPADLSAIVERLRLADDSAEAGALVGTLSGLLPKVSAEGGSAAELTLRALVACLPRHVESDDVELRRRSLTLLGELGARPDTAIDVSFLVPRLHAEPLPELRTAALELVRRHGGAAEFDRLLELDVLGNVAATLPDGPRLVAELTGALAAGDASRRIGAARALASVEDPAVYENALERAILLSLSGSTDLPSTTTASDRAEVVAWALELRARVGPLTAARGVDASGAPLPPRLARSTLDQLLDDVLPGAALDHATALCARALLGADADRPVEAVDQLFKDAVAVLAADETRAAHELWELRREYARYLVRLASIELARAEFRSIVSAPDGAGARWLGLAGIEEYVALLPLEASADARVALERCAALTAAVELEEWATASDSRRIANLTDLLASAQVTKDAATMQRSLEVLRQRTSPDGAYPEAWSTDASLAAALGSLIELRVALESFVAAHSSQDGASEGSGPDEISEPVPGPQDHGPVPIGG